MALYFTNTVRVKPGHTQDYLAWAPKIIPFCEKYGVKLHGAFGAASGEANVVVYLVSMRDWAAYGNAIQRGQADTQFQAASRKGADHVDGNVVQPLVPLPGSGMQ